MNTKRSITNEEKIIVTINTINVKEKKLFPLLAGIITLNPLLYISQLIYH